MDTKRRAFLFALFLACASCSGGGSQNSPVISPAPSPSASTQLGALGAGASPALNQTVSFTVAVPGQSTLTSIAKKSLALRKRQDGTTPYISPNIASVSIALLAVNGVSLAYPPPAPTISNIVCATPITGCSLTIGGVVAAVGTNRYLVSTYTLPGGAATPNNVTISSGLVDVVVTGNGTVNTTLGDPSQLAIGGYVATIALSSTQTPNPLLIGSTGIGTILVTALDVAGATIIGNALFAQPITISGNGIVLTGPGLQSNGTYVLTMPEMPSTVVGFTYDGTASFIGASATTLAASGASISALPLTIPLGTPAPGPTATPTATPGPTSSPTPTAKPTATPAPLPSGASPRPTASPTPKASPTPSPVPTALTQPNSLYVLTAGANVNSVVEYALNASGMPTTFRRSVSASTLGCPSSLTPYSDPISNLQYGFGVAGITADAAGNVYVSSSGDTCMPAGASSLYAIAPGASGATFGKNTLPIQANAAGADIELSADNSNGSIDVDPSQAFNTASNETSYAYGQFAYSGTSGGVARTVNLIGADPASFLDCIVSTGFQPTQNNCADTSNDANGVDDSPYFVARAESDQETNSSAYNLSPLVADALGNTYTTVFDNQSLNSQVDEREAPAIVELKDAKNSLGPAAASPGVAEATWIEGLDTLMFPFAGSNAMAYDASTNRLFVLESDIDDFGGQFWSVIFPTQPYASVTSARPDFCTDASGSSLPAAPLCTDGNEHYWIVAYNLSALTPGNPCPQSLCNYSSGASDTAPVLVIGGDKLHLPPSLDASGLGGFPQNLIPQNGLAAANGRVYLTNPLGPNCNSACKTSETSGLLPTAGEIDVYDGTATGYFNNSSPGSVFLGAFQDAAFGGVPVGVVIAPHGSVTTAPSLRHAGERAHNLPIRRVVRPNRARHVHR